MPRSKRPRKKYRPKPDVQIRGAGVMDIILFRAEDWGNENWEIAARFHCVRPFTELLQKQNMDKNWGQAKVVLIEGFGTALYFNECDRIRREIKAANRLLNAAYTVWKERHELLQANIEAARDVTLLIVDMWRQMNPGEVVQGCQSLNDKDAMDRLEAKMEGFS